MYAKYTNEDISNKNVYIFVVQQVGLNVYNRKLYFNIVQSKNLRLPWETQKSNVYNKKAYIEAYLTKRIHAYRQPVQFFKKVFIQTAFNTNVYMKTCSADITTSFKTLKKLWRPCWHISRMLLWQYLVIKLF